MSERIVPRLTDQIQGVGETIVQVAFDRHGLVERSTNIFRDLFGKLRYARIKRRKLQIRCGDKRRIVRRSRAQLGCIEGRQAGNTGIPYGTIIVEGIQKRAGGIPKDRRDRKSTRLNSSHSQISYAVFCLKKKKTDNE